MRLQHIRVTMLSPYAPASPDDFDKQHELGQFLTPTSDTSPLTPLPNRLDYLWLSSPAQAIARVRRRVQQGGHHVPAADIRRRFRRSLVHLGNDYLPLATRWAIWDSRCLPAKQLAISPVDTIETVRPLIGL